MSTFPAKPMSPRWIRRTAVALGVVLLLLVAAAAVLVATFDANRYKGLAIDWMKNERQRTLVIDGPIELSLLPRLAIKASRLRLSERGRADEFASIDEVSLTVQILPLLHKQLVIDRVSARGVRAVYGRVAKDAYNVDDLFAGGKPGAPTGGPALRLDISAVHLEAVQLRLRDDVANLAGEIGLQSFTSGRLANLAETPVALQASIELTRPQPVKLALDGRMTLTLDLDKRSIAVNGLKLDAQGDIAAVKGLAATLDGALAWDGSALRAGPLQVALRSGSLGSTALAASTLDLKKLVVNPAGRQLELEAMQLAMTGKYAGRQGGSAFELALDWPQLAVNGEQLQGSALSGRYKLAGPTALAGSFRSAAPSGNFDALRLPGFAITLAGNAGPRKIDGNAKADLLLRIDRSALALERLDLNAAVAEPGLQPLQIVLRGSAGIDAKSAQWQVDGALNTNRFDGKGSAAFGGPVPRLEASARFDSLDLNKLLGPAGKPTPTAGAAADTPVELDGLRAVNGQFALSAAALAFRQYKVVDARVDAGLDNGTLRVARLAGRAWGGSLEGSGSADARGQRIAIKLAASGVNVNALLRDVTGKDLLEGNGRVTADLTTSGTSLGALRSNLAGTAALQVRDGAVKGVNLARALRQAKAALLLKQDAPAKARETEKTEFSELTASARIAGGVAHSDDLDVKNPFLRIGGAGRFDIGRGTIDYTARASVIAVPPGLDAGDLAALRGVTVPVRLTGPFEAIDWTIEWSSVAAAVVENRLKQRLAEKLGGSLGERLGTAPAAAGAASAPATPQDRLKEKLKGLFK